MTSSVTQRWATRLSAFDELTGKWRAVQLLSIQKDHETTQASLQLARENLANERRAVSTRTKEFARLSSEEKQTEVFGLIKMYQSHIDELTRHSKVVEELYAELAGAVQRMTDPYPLMEKFSRERQTILDFIKRSEENAALRRDLAERESELMDLKNQEVTIENLRAALAQCEREKAVAMQQSAADAASGWNHMLERYQIREGSLTSEIHSLQADTAKWKRLYTEASDALLVSSTRIEQLDAQREQEVALLIEELDEAKTALAVRERELRRLAEATPALFAAQHPTTPSSSLTPPAALDDSLTPARSATRTAQTLMLEEHIALLQAAMEKSEAQLKEQMAAVDTEKQRSMEVTNKCRAAEDMVAQLQELLKAALDEVENQKARVRASDAELARAMQNLRVSESELAQRDTALLTHPSSSAMGNDHHHKPTPDAFSLEGVLLSAGGNSNPSAAGTSTSMAIRHVSGDSGVEDDAYVAIAAQRDRLRQRLLALEEASSQEIHRLQLELQSLRGSLTSSSGSNAAGSSSAVVHISVGGGDDVELSGGSGNTMRRPLLLFTEGITQAALLEVLDRGNWILSRTVLTNLSTRRAFVAYLGVLHIYLLLSLLAHVLLG